MDLIYIIVMELARAHTHTYIYANSLDIKFSFQVLELLQLDRVKSTLNVLERGTTVIFRLHMRVRRIWLSPAPENEYTSRWIGNPRFPRVGEISRR